MLHRLIFALTLGVAFGLTVLGGYHLSQSAEPAATPPGDALLNEVLAQIEREYVDPVDDQRLMTEAVRGLVSGLDNHSQFLDAGQYADIRVSASGNYSGVGLEVTLQGREVVVIAPLAGSPADRAGIRSGDIIIAIDDHPVDSNELFSTVQQLRGDAGSDVQLSLLRSGERDARQVILKRAALTIDSVSAELMAPDIGYLRLTQFHEQTVSELRTALNRLVDDNLTPLTGLVLDLRDNPGGLLDAAVEVADLFLDEGVILSARGRSASAQFRHSARVGSVLPDAELIVLINGASASAAEILAAALKDNGRARLLGTSTFGKGLVQTVVPLSAGRAIKLTTSRYFTPSGDYIDKKGLTPDIVVRQGAPGGADLQRQKAFELLSRERLILSER